MTKSPKKPASKPQSSAPPARQLSALKLDSRISQKVAGELAGVTPAFINRLCAEGWIARGDDSKTTPREAFQGYLRFLKDEGRRTSKSASAGRVQDARAEEIALRTDERKKRLLAEAQAEALGIIDEFFGGLRADLNSLPARLTTDLVLRKKLTDAIDAAFAGATRKSIAAANLAPAAGAALRATAAAAPGRMGGGEPELPAKHRRTRTA